MLVVVAPPLFEPWLLLCFTASVEVNEAELIVSQYMEDNNCVNSLATSQPLLNQLPAFFITLYVSQFVLFHHPSASACVVFTSH